MEYKLKTPYMMLIGKVTIINIWNIQNTDHNNTNEKTASPKEAIAYLEYFFFSSIRNLDL